MSPQDKICFDLVPAAPKPGESPEDQFLAMEAAKEHALLAAEQAGLTATSVGTIEPDAIENHRREAKIAEAVEPTLQVVAERASANLQRPDTGFSGRASINYERDSTHYFQDGQVRKTTRCRISSSAEVSGSAESLKTAIEAFAGAVKSIAFDAFGRLLRVLGLNDDE